MPEPMSILASVGVAAAITFALRALPFTVVRALRRSAAVRYLAEQLPAGVMIVLVVYCLRSIDPASVSEVLPTLVSLNITIALHLWRGNALLSIFGGTAAHIALLSTVFR